jgi:ABC-type phosphate transport system permease subunit
LLQEFSPHIFVARSFRRRQGNSRHDPDNPDGTLPPTVIGFLLLMLISPKSMIGQALKSWFDLTLTMNWYSAIFAVTIVTFPLMYRTVRAAFEAFDRNLIYAGQTLGLSDRFIFRKILLPNCKSGIIAGIVLSVARGLGEYGATAWWQATSPAEPRRYRPRSPITGRSAATARRSSGWS